MEEGDGLEGVNELERKYGDIVEDYEGVWSEQFLKEANCSKDSSHLTKCRAAKLRGLYRRISSRFIPSYQFDVLLVKLSEY